MFESEKKLLSALKEVMEWINNWDVPFLEDEEWQETEARVRAAIEESEEFLEQ